MERSIGTVFSVSKDKFWGMIEDDRSHIGYFVHHSNVVDHIVLRLHDRVEFTVAPNPRKPGWFQAIDVKVVGRAVPTETAVLP